MFALGRTPIPGVFELRPTLSEDTRGRFVKVFHADFFAAHGLEAMVREVFYSVSGPGVLRGLHVQLPPHDHAKIVGCVAGSAFDAVVDLRKGSPTFQGHATFALSAERGNLIYIPRGVAHGFCVENGEAILFYLTSTVHAPSVDTGIAWHSAGIRWPLDDPVLSDRDRTFPELADFESPFVYDDSAS